MESARFVRAHRRRYLTLLAATADIRRTCKDVFAVAQQLGYTRCLVRLSHGTLELVLVKRR